MAVSRKTLFNAVRSSLVKLAKFKSAKRYETGKLANLANSFLRIA